MPGDLVLRTIRSRGPHDGDELAFLEVERDLPKHIGAPRAGLVELFEIIQPDQRLSVFNHLIGPLFVL